MRVPRFFLVALLATRISHAGTLELSTVDEAGSSLPCRILVRGSDGHCAVPNGATTLQTGPDQWFMSPGRCRLEIPPGEAIVRIEHGTEFVRIKERLQIHADSVSKTYPLRRWIDMPKRGYQCGENHLHVDTIQLAPMLVAEGLDFGSSLTWWNGPDPERPIPAGEGPARLLEYAGRKVPTSVYDVELEYKWGAAYIQNLPAPMPLKAEPGRPNLDYLRHAVDAGAIVHYQGGWSREVMLDALAGCVHTVNVCNNNFALHRFQPRSIYSNLLDVPNFPIYPDTDISMLQMNTDTYYRLLNCGLRLAAGAGTATGVKQSPVGYNRAYVRTAENATLDEFNAAWKAGRNFVTNGPMLFLQTESGERPGDMIKMPQQGGTVQLQVEAVSDQPLQKVEVIVNGAVAAAWDAGDAKAVNQSTKLQIAAGSWIAARCTARDDLLDDEELAEYRDTTTAGKNRGTEPSRLRFAHTSPIYVLVGGQSAAVRPSIDEGLQMLDRLEAFTRSTAEARYQVPMLDTIQTAREQLKKRAAAARP